MSKIKYKHVVYSLGVIINKNFANLMAPGLKQIFDQLLAAQAASGTPYTQTPSGIYISEELAEKLENEPDNLSALEDATIIIKNGELTLVELKEEKEKEPHD